MRPHSIYLLGGAHRCSQHLPLAAFGITYISCIHACICATHVCECIRFELNRPTAWWLLASVCAVAAMVSRRSMNISTGDFMQSQAQIHVLETIATGCMRNCHDCDVFDRINSNQTIDSVNTASSIAIYGWNFLPQ